MHQDRIERITFMLPAKPAVRSVRLFQRSDNPSALLFHGLNSAGGGKNLVNLILPLNIVQLPCSRWSVFRWSGSLRANASIRHRSCRGFGGKQTSLRRVLDPANVQLLTPVRTKQQCRYNLSQIDGAVDDFFRFFFPPLISRVAWHQA